MSRFRKEAGTAFSRALYAFKNPRDYVDPLHFIEKALERRHRLTLRAAAKTVYCERKKYWHPCGQDVPADVIRKRILSLYQKKRKP